MKIYRAVVEDNGIKNDVVTNTNKDGKVRVRIFGIHTENNENSNEKFNIIKTEELPWAEIMQPLSYGYNTGIGISRIPNNGTIVFVILEFDNPNRPIIIGACGGTSTVSSKGIYSSGSGFTDPEEKFPLDTRLNEPDINRLARVDNLSKTIHNDINTSLDIVTKTDSTSGANVAQAQPLSTNDKSKYTNVTVTESKSGHVIEIDDTVDNERIRVYHKSGTYIEIQPDGSIVNKSVGLSNNYIHIGDVNNHIKKSVKTYIENNIDEIIDGYVKREIGSNLDEHVIGNLTETTDGNLTETTGGNLTETVSGTSTHSTTGSNTITASVINLN